ncbi:hypothetical protein CJF30_00008683 [Rutstroemia sp. NJR-2017a BBW]|nr:hypothetical protein CJF30_00008683 [Rutstroemia sp. NJR-2017a BBW]
MSSGINLTATAQQPRDTPENHGPLINILIWFFLVVSSLAVSTRIATKWFVSHNVNYDDALVLLALFLYTSNILWTTSQCFAKLSAIHLLRLISPVASHERATLWLAGGTIIWCFISVIVLIFQCHLPQMWEFHNNTCIDRPAFWNFSNAINILLDLSLILFPVVIIWNLHASTRRKFVVFACFGARIFTVAAVIFQIVTVNKASDPYDFTFDYWVVAVAMSLSQSLGIVASCIPYLKPFFDALESGMIRSDDINRRGDVGHTRVYGGGYGKGTNPESYGSKFGKSAVKSRKEAHSSDGIALRPLSHTIASITTARADRAANHDAEVESQSSETHIIKQTKTWGVTSVHRL